MKLAGKRAIVTGAAGNGIGRAIARAFVGEGAAVVVIDKRLPQATHIDDPTYLQADVSDSDQLTKCLARAWDSLGSVDILVNAAGITQRKAFLDVALADWDEMHAVNVRPYFVATQWLARRLVDNGSPGSIISIASINGSIATVGQSHYCAAKGGVVQLTKAAAVELAPYRIRVNSISPGCIETDLNRDLLSTGEFLKLRTAAIPMERVGQAQEVAPVAVLLVSDDGGFITGADYLVDGGQTVW